VAGAGRRGQILALGDGLAEALGGERVEAQVAIQGHAAVGVLDRDVVPIAAAAGAAVVVGRVDIGVTDDSAGGDRDHLHGAGIHLIPAEGPEGVVGAGVTVVGARA